MVWDWCTQQGLGWETKIRGGVKKQGELFSRVLEYDKGQI